MSSRLPQHARFGTRSMERPGYFDLKSKDSWDIINIIGKVMCM